jgi:hypothetical protein
MINLRKINEENFNKLTDLEKQKSTLKIIILMQAFNDSMYLRDRDSNYSNERFVSESIVRIFERNFKIANSIKDEDELQDYKNFSKFISSLEEITNSINKFGLLNQFRKDVAFRLRKNNIDKNLSAEAFDSFFIGSFTFQDYKEQSSCCVVL